jgi:hypothetical protein
MQRRTPSAAAGLATHANLHTHFKLAGNFIDHHNIRGASKIKLKKVNKKRTVIVRRVVIFLNISRHPLLI